MTGICICMPFLLTTVCRRFEVILNRNGSLNAALILTDDDVEIHTFRGNFTDGYRHFIMLTFNDPRGMSITVGQNVLNKFLCKFFKP